MRRDGAGGHAGLAAGGQRLLQEGSGAALRRARLGPLDQPDQRLVAQAAFKGPLVDLDLHHPPCRGCRASQAFHALGWIARVLLRAVQFTALRKRARRHGLRPVIRHAVRTAAYMVRSARRLSVRFARTNLQPDWLYEAMTRLEARAPP